jgi:hypothetical protein
MQKKKKKVPRRKKASKKAKSSHKPFWVYVALDEEEERYVASSDARKVESAIEDWIRDYGSDSRDRDHYMENNITVFRFDKNDPENMVEADLDLEPSVHIIDRS